MIVFTATNLVTRDVYVGSARESVEEEWANLLSQAENGTGGEFFDQLREQGSAGFEVDTWAYGENPAEARESMREAREELGAKPIKSSRVKPAVRKPAAQQSDSMKALMEAIQEAMSDDGGSGVDDSFDGLLPEKKAARADEAEPTAASELTPVAKTEPAACEAVAKAESVSTVVAEPSASASAFVAASSPESSADSEEAKMMARLEAMKAAQAKLLREREQQRDQTSPAVRKAPAKPMKLASGRTNSSAKEKRIREAIEIERERREQARNSSNRDEYDEMNALMARVEMRRLAAKRAKAEKSKAAAAEKRKQERRKKADAQATAAAPAVERSPVSGSTNETSVSVAGHKVEVLTKSRKPTSTRTSSNAKAKGTDSAPLKLSAGRTGSTAKEKRIKEAIEQEKAERLAHKSAQSAAEADEMSAILARLDERAKAAEKFKRRR